MTPLTQQPNRSAMLSRLEDKKKEIAKHERGDCHCCDNGKCLIIIHILQAEIAILEQAIAEMQKQRQEILDLFGEETKKEWEDGFYENEWNCDTLKVTPLEAKIVSELTSFLPRHMEVYDWNLPYAEEIILIIRRVIKEQLNQPKTEK